MEFAKKEIAKNSFNAKLFFKDNDYALISYKQCRIRKESQIFSLGYALFVADTRPKENRNDEDYQVLASKVIDGKFSSLSDALNNL